MGARRELKAEQREGYLMHFLKSTWYTFALGLFLLAGTLVFMGIEGNHEEFTAYKRLEEQNEFNTTLRAWLKGNTTRAVVLRRQIGLTESLSVEDYSKILAKQLNENLTRIGRFNGARCSYAKYNLTAWNAKTGGDAFMYTISIMSTIGWGVYYPPGIKLRIITLGYLLFGIPIFAVMINHIVRFLNWFEIILLQRKWVQRYLGDGNLIAGVQAAFLFFIIILCGVTCDFLVEEERDSVLEKALIITGANVEWSFLISVYYTVQTATTIGFGDIYVYSPTHALLNIAPVISTLVTAFSIALFVRVFSKLQTKVEKTAEKKTLGARKLWAAVKLGDIRANRTVGNLTRDNTGEENKKDNN